MLPSANASVAVKVSSGSSMVSSATETVKSMVAR